MRNKHSKYNKNAITKYRIKPTQNVIMVITQVQNKQFIITSQ